MASPIMVYNFSSTVRVFFVAAVLLLLNNSCGNNLQSKEAKLATPVNTIRVVMPEASGEVLKNIAALFARQVEQRCNAKVVNTGNSELNIELAIDTTIGPDGFKISDGQPGTIRITGNNERGILYGIGKLLRSSRYEQDGFIAGSWRGISVPGKPVRGIYLATHFHNFYHVASVQEMKNYVEDVALWGYNVLLVWYDMHHFNGFDDPAAVAFRSRLHLIQKAAHDIGLDVAWGDVGNAGYNNSPEAIRAVRCEGRGAQFACDICPAAPGGTEYILENSTKLLKDFADVQPKYYFIWPYDNGGCNSEQCKPWATNGYIRIAQLLAKQMKQYIPEAKVIMSTWFFSAEERIGFDSLLSNQYKGLAGYLMSNADSVFQGAGRFPLLSFPEITMIGWEPWGGYGAAPLPDLLEKSWRAKSDMLSGGFPYSEGLYDDINKALYAQFYWQPDRPAADIVKEYIAFEFSPDVVDTIARVVSILEHNHKRQDIDSSAEEAYRLIQQAETKLSVQARTAWRWRMVALRALIDKEIFTTVPRPVFKQQGRKGPFTASIPQGSRLREAMEELRKIYHAENIDTANADEVWVLPPQVNIGPK